MQYLEMGIKRDVLITLNSVNYEDTYDGAFTTRRAVNYTLGFTAKTYLYGLLHSSKVIKETQTDMFVDTASGATREQRIVVVKLQLLTQMMILVLQLL